MYVRIYNTFLKVIADTEYLPLAPTSVFLFGFSTTLCFLKTNVGRRARFHSCLRQANTKESSAWWLLGIERMKSQCFSRYKSALPNCTGNLLYIITPESHDMKGRMEELREQGLCDTWYVFAYVAPIPDWRPSGNNEIWGTAKDKATQQDNNVFFQFLTTVVSMFFYTRPSSSNSNSSQPFSVLLKFSFPLVTWEQKDGWRGIRAFQ